MQFSITGQEEKVTVNFNTDECLIEVTAWECLTV
jgi:hypothetical protein